MVILIELDVVEVESQKIRTNDFNEIRESDGPVSENMLDWTFNVFVFSLICFLILVLSIEK